jgi:putative copper resistance protein D
MVDAIATLARWVQLVSNLILLGSCLFLIITSTVKQIHSEVWVGRLERLFPWLAVSMLTGLLVILATTIVQVTGSANSLGEYEVWLGLLGDTRVGQIWILRFAAAILLLLAILYLCNVSKTRWRYALCVAIATLPLIASSLASHAAAEELSVTAVMPYALHLILAGVWFGALPAFMLLIFDKTNKTNKFNILRRFSSVALPVMLLIIFTGLIVANQIFDGYYAALVATPYGWLLSIKIFLLVIILLIAAGVRSYWLPLLNCKQDSDVSNGNNGIRRWVRIEFILALLLLLLATIITNTTPAKHTLIENWPFSFRNTTCIPFSGTDAAVNPCMAR